VSATLHRCRTPTDWLCPCGRAARELRKHEVEFAELRHARDRRAIEQLTGQRRLPVLELGRDVISDSKRIVEHLRWRAAR
jgi:glutathione S-transferase